MSDLIELDSHSVRTTINILLKDRSTAQNIIFATNAYDNINFDSHITKKIIAGNMIDLRPRVAKTQAEQAERTRKKAEVFTPAWICNWMNNQCDSEWFGRENIFNIGERTQWHGTEGKLDFPDNKSWKDYVRSKRLEIACGEGPYLVSRYDAVSGEAIPIEKRVGVLDRKLRIINENAKTHRTWNHWAYIAFESTYGYEYQGDNLLVARINLLETFCEYTRYRWHVEPSETSLKRIARIISWNMWQMDGILGRVPQEEKLQTVGSEKQLLLFDIDEAICKTIKLPLSCKIRDWKKDDGKRQVLWERGMDMKFDFVIGNPPYQENLQDTSDKPVYNYFMDAAYDIGEKVELITPARFLFNAGKTPKEWNKKMLNDEHFKVLYYEQDSSKLFVNTDIKGGVAITYYDGEKNYGAIETYTQFLELNHILSKVKSVSNRYISDIVFSPESYKFTNKLYKDHGNILKMTQIVKGKKVPLMSKGHTKDLTSNIFDKLLNIVFFADKPNDDKEYIQIVGRISNSREYMWIRKEYIENHSNLNKYKLFFPKSSGSGKFGENLSAAIVAMPNVGHTQTFISMGKFDTKEESEYLNKYLKCKFARTLLGVLKVTQDNKKSVWKYVPLQNFTSFSDIDWSQSIADIDKQLYQKYNLSAEEIAFIEGHVKEME